MIAARWRRYVQTIQNRCWLTARCGRAETAFTAEVRRAQRFAEKDKKAFFSLYFICANSAPSAPLR